MCSCSSGNSNNNSLFINCSNFNTQRQTLFDKIATIDANILNENEDSLVNVL